MKLMKIEPKSELSNTILQSMRTNPEKAEHITNAAELASALQKGDICVVVKTTLEHFRIRSRERERRFEERLQNIMLCLGVPPHLKGFRYLKDAIKFTYDDPKLVESMQKTLYVKVASVNGTTAGKAQRDIRNAVDQMSRMGRVENLNIILNLNPAVFTRGVKIKNSELIALIANRLRIEFPIDAEWDV